MIHYRVEVGRGLTLSVKLFLQTSGINLKRVFAKVKRVGVHSVANLTYVALLSILVLLVLEEVVRRSRSFLSSEIVRLTAQAAKDGHCKITLVVVLAASSALVEAGLARGGACGELLSEHTSVQLLVSLSLYTVLAAQANE